MSTYNVSQIGESAARRLTQQPIEAAHHPDALLKLKTISAITGLSGSTIYRKEADGTFPKLIRIGKRCTRARAGDIVAWLQSQAAK